MNKTRDNFGPVRETRAVHWLPKGSGEAGSELLPEQFFLRGGRGEDVPSSPGGE